MTLTAEKLYAADEAGVLPAAKCARPEMRRFAEYQEKNAPALFQYEQQETIDDALAVVKAMCRDCPLRGEPCRTRAGKGYTGVVDGELRVHGQVRSKASSARSAPTSARHPHRRAG